MIDKSNLGKEGPPVGRLGYGAMVLEGYYGVSDDDDAVKMLLHQGQDNFPIPGTRSIQRIDENASAINVQLDAAALQRIDEIAKPGIAQGATLL